MYIINTIPHGKCFVRYLRTRCFCIRNRTRSLRSLVRFPIGQQLVPKYRTPALSMKFSLHHLRPPVWPAFLAGEQKNRENHGKTYKNIGKHGETWKNVEHMHRKTGRIIVKHRKTRGNRENQGKTEKHGITGENVEKHGKTGRIKQKHSKTWENRAKRINTGENRKNQGKT